MQPANLLLCSGHIWVWRVQHHRRAAFDNVEFLAKLALMDHNLAFLVCLALEGIGDGCALVGGQTLQNGHLGKERLELFSAVEGADEQDFPECRAPNRPEAHMGQCAHGGRTRGVVHERQLAKGASCLHVLADLFLIDPKFALAVFQNVKIVSFVALLHHDIALVLLDLEHCIDHRLQEILCEGRKQKVGCNRMPNARDLVLVLGHHCRHKLVVGHKRLRGDTLSALAPSAAGIWSGCARMALVAALFFLGKGLAVGIALLERAVEPHVALEHVDAWAEEIVEGVAVDPSELGVCDLCLDGGIVWL
eukprot:comp20941_c0_seq4/m.43743 comp20941_c0_seq4/g.43743  ORF comp20941_c0_seq4/g.43743 comp20941_c0_seq4/m.43743 type:complete len:306 (-) comp20941_c0_seq4:342-1259(-)